MLRLITGIAGPSGFGSASTAEQVTEAIDAAHLTVIVTGMYSDCLFNIDRVFICHVSSKTHRFSLVPIRALGLFLLYFSYY